MELAGLTDGLEKDRLSPCLPQEKEPERTCGVIRKEFALWRRKIRSCGWRPPEGKNRVF
jgi:hypothetical protein